MKRLSKFLQMTSGERHLVINTFIVLLLVRLGLCLLPFQVLEQLLARISEFPKSPQFGSRRQDHEPTLDNIVKAVNRSSWQMPGNVKCLARALTTQVVMSRCGYAPLLRIGVTKSVQGHLEAHAWVESHGQIVMGYLSDLSRYTPMSSITRT